MKLRTQLIGLVLLILAAAFAFLALFNHFLFQHYFREYEERLMAEKMRAVAAMVADLYEEDGNFGRIPAKVPYFCMMFGICIKVVDRNGTLVTDYCVNQEQSGAFGRLSDEGATHRPILVKGATVGELFMNPMLHEPLTGSPEDVLRKSLRFSILVASVLAGLLALVAGWLFSRKLLRPVALLTDAARKVSEGDLDQRISVASKNELGELAGAFNRMAGSLLLHENLRKKLVEDIAHDLRTPLTTLLGTVEAMQDGVLEPGRARLHALHGELVRLSALVSDIGKIAKAEAQKLHLKPETFDAASVAREVARELGELFQEKGVTCTVAPDARALVFADREAVRRALFNVAHNGFKFSPPGAMVRITPSFSGRAATLVVEDAGPGIPPEDLPFIFERFYRGQSALGEEGSGVGLCIAKELITASGGGIVAESTGSGARFTVTLPSAPG